MSDKSALVCVFNGGKFVRGRMLEYVGEDDLVQVDISSMSC